MILNKEKRIVNKHSKYNSRIDISNNQVLVEIKYNAIMNYKFHEGKLQKI